MSGNQRITGRNRLQERAQELIERGLTRYRQGEVDAAMTDWRHALALDPKADRAREYIEHALAHKDDLDGLTLGHAQADADADDAGGPALPHDRDRARNATAGATDATPLPRDFRKPFEGSPMPSGHLDEDGEDLSTEKLLPRPEPGDTQPLSLSPPARGGPFLPPLEALPREARPRQAPPLEALPREAWIEDMPAEDTEPLSRPPPGMVQDEPPVSLAPTVELPRAEVEMLSQIETAHIRTLARTQLDALETYEISIAELDEHPVDQARRAARPPVVPPVVIEDVEEEEPALARSPAGDDVRSQARAGLQRTQTAQLYATARQVPSRPPSGLAGVVSKISTPAAGRAAPAGDGHVGAPAAPPTRPMDPVVRMLLERLDDERPARPGDEDVQQERVLWLIEYAQSEYIGGDYQTAITALDLALDEAPDSAVVQALIAQRTEALIEIYASYEGDPQAVPALAMSANEYGQRALDSHPAFLLSRVDGMLTIDDLVTVSGMPPLETHRHLCNLLRQRIWTLR